METTKKIKRVNKDEPTGFDRFNRVSKGANAVLNIIFIIMSLLCVIPILLVVAISFSAEDSITEYGYRFIPKIFSLEGYTFLASQSTMLLRALGVSLFVTIVGTVLGVMLTTLMGYVLSRPNYKLNGFLTMVVFIPMVFNGGLVSTYFVVSQLLGLKNTIWALILPAAPNRPQARQESRSTRSSILRAPMPCRTHSDRSSDSSAAGTAALRARRMASGSASGFSSRSTELYPWLTPATPSRRASESAVFCLTAASARTG